MTERDYLLALDRIPGFGPITVAGLLQHFGSYEQIWRAPTAQVASLVSNSAASAFARTRTEIRPGEIARELDRTGMSTVTLIDDAYPPLLREIHAAPLVLYYYGTLPEAPMLGVVGTRRATSYGRRITEEIIGGLSGSGLAIVSGLAFGIDAAAHQAALTAGISTIAVIASPPERIQPATHIAIARSIVSSGGAVVSEYPPGTQPGRGLFPARNRIIAGLSRAVLIVEAGVPSGALITARQALAENREVLAVPGPVDSPSSIGTNQLIRDGAGLVRSAADVLEAFGIEVANTPRTPVRELPEEPLQQRIVLSLDEPLHFDELASRTTAGAAELGTALSLLEMGGRIRHLGGNIFTRL